MRRRDMLAGMTASLLSSATPAFAKPQERVLVRVETELGTLLIAVFPQKAPVTVANFLAYVDGHYLDHGSVYRIVTPDNQHPEPAVKISIVQWGMNLGSRPPPLPPIAHETTAMTGTAPSSRHRVHGAGWRRARRRRSSSSASAISPSSISAGIAILTAPALPRSAK